MLAVVVDFNLPFLPRSVLNFRPKSVPVFAFEDKGTLGSFLQSRELDF
jgi:hypothetical protein